MRVRGNVVYKAFLQQCLCGSVALVEEPAFNEICRKLQAAAHILHLVGDVQIVLDGLVALGVRHDNGKPLALDGVYVALPIHRQMRIGEFQQKKIRVANAQIRCLIHSQLCKLLPVNLVP